LPFSPKIPLYKNAKTWYITAVFIFTSFFTACTDHIGLGDKLPVLVKPPYKVVANVIITAQPE